MGMSRRTPWSVMRFDFVRAVRVACAIFASVAAVFDGTASVIAAEGSRPAWAGSVEALLLWRDGPAARPLYFESADPASVPLDAGGIATGMAAGPRYAIEWSGNGTDAVEFNYFNVESFAGSRRVASPGGGLEQADIFGFRFPDVTSATAASSAGIKSFELNRRRALGRLDGDFIYGFRWVEWNERLAVTDTTLTGSVTGSDFFSADTTDSLYGAQIGLDLVLVGSRAGRAWIEGLGKAGIYYDRAVQHSFVDSVSTDQVIRSTATSADLTSFFGELGFTGCVRLSQHWVARTGFTMFWLGNLAEPAAQFSANNLFSDEIRTGITSGASTFLYGLNLGLEASW